MKCPATESIVGNNRKNMLNTWIEILCRYAKRWLEGEEIPITENFNKATDEIIEVNDIVKDFVESKLLITKVHKSLYRFIRALFTISF